MTTVDVESISVVEEKEKSDDSSAATLSTNNCEEERSKMEGEGKVRDKETWRCPDPGCKKANNKADSACSQCTLPRQSAQQFKRGGNRDGGGGRGWGGRSGGGGGRGWNRGGGGGRGGYHRDRNNWGGRSGGGGYQGGGGRRMPEGIDLTNPTILQFREHASELDKKHDKYERIVKISRDVTIESKRIIFLLHRITCDDEKPAVLADAEGKMGHIRHRLWKNLAYELRGEDPYQFIRAYSAGLQEYVEALSFYHYICFGRLISWDEVQNDLMFGYHREKRVASKVSAAETDAKETDEQQQLDGEEKPSKVKSSENDDVEQADEPIEAEDEKKPVVVAVVDDDISAEVSDVVKKSEDKLIVFVPKGEFVLGLADLTGEVMRQAINLVGSGETDVCFDLLQFLHEIHNGFLSVGCYGGGNREMAKKTQVLEQSLKKVENACYTINVRGSEVPKHLLATYFNTGEEFNPDQYSTFSDD